MFSASLKFLYSVQKVLSEMYLYTLFALNVQNLRKYLWRSFSKTAGKRFLLDFYVTFTFHWILPKLLIEYFKFTLTRFFAMKFINSMQTNVYVTLSLFIFFNFASTQNIEKAPHLFYHHVNIINTNLFGNIFISILLFSYLLSCF